jgi:Phytanoyl-CoA dioxygenase (PhyH)
MHQRRVSAQEVAEFRARGHVLLREVFEAQRIDELAAAAIVTAQEYASPGTTPRDMWKRSTEIQRLIFEEGLGEIAAHLLGVDRIRLIHDAFFQKTGSTWATPWHRDSDFWAFEGAGALTMWIPLQDTPTELALSYVSGSHLRGHGRVLRRLEKAMLPLYRSVSRGALRMGDIAVHNCHTLHASSKYCGTQTRRALAVHVIDGNARVAVPRTPFQQSHSALSNWMSVQPGHPLPDAIAPLIFAEHALTNHGLSHRQPILVPS